MNGKRYQLSTGCKDLAQGLIAFEEFLLQHGVKQAPGSGRRVNTDRPNLPKGLYWKGSVIWLSRVADGKHYNLSAGTSDPDLAGQFLASFDLKVFKGERLGVIAKLRITFEQIASRYLEQGKLNGLRVKSLARYKEISSNFSKFLNIRGMGSNDAKNITPSLIEDYKIWRSITPLRRNAPCLADAAETEPLGAAPKTLQLEMRCISAFFKHAVRLRLIDENPVERTRSMRVISKTPIYLDEGDLNAFLTAAAEADQFCRQQYGTLLYRIFFTYLKTGMRLQELRHLEWTDVDFDRGEIHVRQGKTIECKERILLSDRAIQKLQLLNQQDFAKLSVKERQELLSPGRISSPKLIQAATYDDFNLESRVFARTYRVQWNPKSTGRAIPISQSLHTLMQQLPRVSNLVFPDPICGGLWRFDINRLVKACARRANIIKPIHTHTLRHTFATHLRRKGVAIETIQKLLGHEDIHDTMIYAQFSPEEARIAIPKIDFF